MMGRKPAPGVDPESHTVIGVRLTVGMRTAIRTRAGSLDKSISDYVRDLVAADLNAAGIHELLQALR